MRILLIGATGTLGRPVAELLRCRGHEVVGASRRGGDLRVDIADPSSVRGLYERVGPLDAVASAVGSVPYGLLPSLDQADFRRGVADKLLSQVELVRQGQEHLQDGGSFTLISGVTARHPVRGGSIASLVNGGIEAFVRAAATELPRRQRLNAVSPTIVEISLEDFGDVFVGMDAVPVRRVANAYLRSIEGPQTGQVYLVE